MTCHPFRFPALRAGILAVAMLSPLASRADVAGKLGPAIAAEAPSLATGAEALLGTCPAIAKWRFRPNAMGHNLDGFASRCPRSAIVLQPTFDDLEARTVAEAPAQAAQLVWNEMSLFQTLLTARDGRLWLEGPTADKLPGWQAAGGPAWLTAFWQALAEMVQASGAGLLVGLDGVSPGSALDALVEALEERGVRHGFAHAASIDDLCIGEQSAALCFADLLSSLPEGRPLFLTRAGHGRPGVLVLADYVSWLTWFDAALRQQPRVVGAALHDFGSAGETAHDALDETLAGIVSADTPPTRFDLKSCADNPDEGDPDERPDAGTSAEIAGSGAFREADESGCSAAAGGLPLSLPGVATALSAFRSRRRSRATPQVQR